MKKVLILMVSVIALSVTTILFINYSNDHSECEVIVETTISEDGLTKVTTTRHSCNENFNF